MKKTGTIFIATALAFASCSKPSAQHEPEAAPPAPSVAVSTPAPATPAPEPGRIAAATPPPAISAPELAPPGVFYLLAAARVETADGIIGLPPGTGVKFVREGIYLTPRGEVSLDASSLTNDLARARQARDADRAAQAAVMTRGASDVAQARVVSAITDVEAGAQQKAAISLIERQKVEARIAALEREKTELLAQADALSTQVRKEHYNEVFKGRTITSTAESRLKAVNQQITVVSAQIRDSRRSLR